jgi:hypothetical protein
MVPRAGFEPATYPLGGDRAIQLCHRGSVCCTHTEDGLPLYLFGTEGRTRTDTVSPPLDFESSASTSSATPAPERGSITEWLSGSTITRWMK